MKTRLGTKIPRRKLRSNPTNWGNLFNFDFSIFLVTLILLIIGVVAVFEASVIEAYRQFGDQFYFAKLQLKWAGLGLIALGVTSFLPLNVFKKLALPGFIFAIVLLLLVLIPGVGVQVGGATRWINLGFFSLQPSEVTKLAIIVYFAALFEKTPKLKPFLGSIGIVIFLIMLQPDLGTTIMISTISLSLFYLAGAQLKEIIGIMATGIVSGLFLILSSPYRRARLMTFLDPSADPLGTSYHIRQIIISLGSGGFWGTGIGRSIQKYQYLPEATTDSIFAVIAEETGFIGTLVIFGLYTFFAYRGFRLINNLPEMFQKLVVAGATSLIVLQAYMNLSAMGALVPLTGITLPFISYGGSSLVVSLIAVGLILNMSRYRIVENSPRRRIFR